MATYYGRFGTRYTTVRQLGAGGEGTVYTLSGYDGIVAKIYKADRFRNSNDRNIMERKLKAMLSMNVAYIIDGIARFAWPQDILYENDVMVGFIMPEIQTKYKIFDMYRGGKNSIREKIYPNYTWKYSVQFAYHLAWLVNHLHSYNIVIGDFNQNNIAIDPKSGTVIIIDCDSFDITDHITGEHFPCTVGLPEMLAPELQTVGNLAKAKFTKYSDYFSLAIHIFRLLMDNADPFGGVITTNASISKIPANQAICNGECVYVRNVPGKVIPNWSQKPSMLPSEILQLFKKTFDYTALTAIKKISNRATAYEWCMALKPYGLPEPNSNLKHCSLNKNHVYPAHNSKCPWCNNIEQKKNKVDNSLMKNDSTKNERGFSFGKVVCAIIVITLLILGYKYYDSQKTESYNTDVFSINTNQENTIYEESAYPTSDEMYAESIKESNSDYIINGSDSRYITEDDLNSLTQQEVQLARNEIFARHGRKFNTDWIREYFEGRSWYVPEYEPDYFDNNLVNTEFNDYEKENIKFIRAYEEKMSY